MPRGSRPMPELSCGHLLGFFLDLLDGADHVKSLFRNIVVFAGDYFLERANRVFQLDVGARNTGKLLGDVERLGEKALHFTGPRNGQFIVFGKLVHAENRDDVL